MTDIPESAFAAAERIGAARGMDAGAARAALRQAALGQDEGTESLLGQPAARFASGCGGYLSNMLDAVEQAAADLEER